MKVALLFILSFIYSKECKASVVINGENCDRQFTPFKPTWESLDKRKLPQWYDDAKFGIFVHWGVYSVPAFHSEWLWYYLDNNGTDAINFLKSNYPPNFTYQDFARDFRAEFFDPVKWAKLFEKAGAKYVVLTSKHHEGYTLWPSEFSFSWNAMDVGPHRDLVGELANAIRNNTKIKFGVYHSLLEWYNPMFLSDKASNFTKNNFVKRKMIPEMIELVEKYKPEVLWSDGDWEATETYWQSKEFLAWLYNESPVRDIVVVNDRWGLGVPCHHGDFYNCKDHYDPGVLQGHKWESATTIYKDSWGYIRDTDLDGYRTPIELISLLVRVVSCGGNVLLNVGPTKEGTIAPIFQERLLLLGRWLSINGEAIYKTKPWIHQNDTLSPTWYTQKSDAIYATTLEWPPNNALLLGLAKDLFKTSGTVVTMFGYNSKLKWAVTNGTVTIRFPDKATTKSGLAWTVKIVAENKI